MTGAVQRLQPRSVAARLVGLLALVLSGWSEEQVSQVVEAVPVVGLTRLDSSC